MGLYLCPTAVIAAPVEKVWELITQPALRDEWWDARTESVVPEGSAAPGQVITLKPLPLAKMTRSTLSIERVDPLKHQIHWRLLGPAIINDQTTTVTPVDAGSCLVQYG